jgi:hypothetical protein
MRVRGWVVPLVQSVVVFMCVFAPLWLRAQEDPCNSKILKPPVDKPPVCPSPSPPGNLADGTKSALSCAWIENPPHPDGTDNVLEALRLLTSSRLVPNVNEKVLAKLHDASPENDELFFAALGNPNEYGQPTVQGLPDFVDILSKANTRGKVEEKDEIDYHHQLFSCTEFVIDQLFKIGTGGKSAIVKINDAFTQKNNYVALYELLHTVWEQNGEAFDADHLEKLRAAFATSVDDLAKQVAAKVTPASK